MSSELTITNIEAVVTKLRLEPGDVLLIRCRHPLNRSSRSEISHAIEESLGVPAMVLNSELTLEAVLNVPPELVERARQLGSGRTRKMLEQLTAKAGSVDA